MLIEKLISPVVPMLQATDTGNQALVLMEENHLSHLPLVIEDKYMALVKENQLLDWITPECPLSAADFLNYKPAVFASGHPYDALKIASEFNLDIVPVVDISNKYIGSITKNDLLRFVTENGGLDSPGGIIILEMAPNNYSLSEIARLCENEDVNIISTQLRNIPETGMIEVTIKTNRTDLGALVSSFERHDYIIKDMYGVVGEEYDMMDNYRQLMTYLNM